MALINKSSITDLLTQMNQQFLVNYNNGFNNAKLYLEPVIDHVSINSSVFKQVFLTSVPQMRKALGQRIVKNLEIQAYGTESSDYEATIGIPRADILSDQWGVYAPAISALGNTSKRDVDRRASRKLQAGTTDLTFDGTAHFSTAHTLNPAGVQSNLLGSSALTQDTFAVAVAAMRSFLDNEGQPLGVEPTVLVVDPSNEKVARVILEADIIAGAATYANQTNVYKGLVSLVVDPDLVNEPGTWYLFGELAGIKAVTHYSFIDPNLVAMTDPKDDNVFHNFQYVWGVDKNDAVLLAPWFLSIRNTP